MYDDDFWIMLWLYEEKLIVETHEVEITSREPTSSD